MKKVFVLILALCMVFAMASCASTDADLDYGNSGSRSSVEMNDPSARPAISGTVSNMEQYDVVFVG